MKKLFILLITSIMLSSCGSAKRTYRNDVDAIKDVMERQERAWSNNDIDGFMEGYWNSSELRFYGASGLTSGYSNVLRNYKLKYPTADLTGSLKFLIDDIRQISENSYYVMGRFELDRRAGDSNGLFMLVFKKIDGQWKIIADTSC